MILDKLSNAQMYESVHPGLKQAFDFLREKDLKGLAPGKYEIDGEDVFVSIQEYETKPIERGRFEAHKHYADIQFLISGAEKIGYRNIDGLKVIEPHQDQDLYFLDASGDLYTVEQDCFMLLTPEDAHMPGLAVDEPKQVKKAVVKVRWN